jgi:hypothetical protein
LPKKTKFPWAEPALATLARNSCLLKCSIAITTNYEGVSPVKQNFYHRDKQKRFVNYRLHAQIKALFFDTLKILK